MGLSSKEADSIKNTIRDSLRNRFNTYNPEPAAIPFHTSLLGKDRLALYAFIHSLNTSFGTTIFEPVAVSLASTRFKIAKSQAKSGTQISEKAQYKIQKIMDSLTAGNEHPDKQKEIEIIRNVCGDGKMQRVKPTRVDIHLESNKGEVYLIDIKTAKPNKGGFKEFKRTLLEWVATVLADKPNARVNSLIAIPYNPYAPKPYSRWTMAGMLDMKSELKVAEEFWNFLGGQGAYSDLLDCFESVGIEMREEIDDYFLKFR